MNHIQNKNLKTFNLNEPSNIFSDVKPTFYSFSESIFTMLKELTPNQRNFAQSIFNECNTYVDKNINLNNITSIPYKNLHFEKLLSNIIYLVKYINIKDSESVKHGICHLICIMKKTRKREFKNIKKLLFFNVEIKKYTNHKLINAYKKTFKDFNKSLGLISNTSEYSLELDKNNILLVKRNDILKEFQRRTKLAKICEIIDKEGNIQGHGYFIPKTSDDDQIIIFFKEKPYTLKEFKKTKFNTKKKNGKICWE